ncbi:magnesium transporter NIPA-domain-containing protein [Irpex rosettiformis]|uniref:Magnesium transporter NIPA-domain-containing protein n=1 Tax=Irpex rosettiformis TaxID=378272 RepID=A0ACB8UL75_9APHY|nr:magnesium transporter NIPA-domain-containing protein [Irpex rosettiformis]
MILISKTQILRSPASLSGNAKLYAVRVGEEDRESTFSSVVEREEFELMLEFFSGSCQVPNSVASMLISTLAYLLRLPRPRPWLSSRHPRRPRRHPHALSRRAERPWQHVYAVCCSDGLLRRNTATPISSVGIRFPPKAQLSHSPYSVGVCLAIGSGVLIGSSFVFKKKGLLKSQHGQVAGEGVAYLTSPMWWTGMTIMILGELCNFAAYAFVEAIIVTPMGALSVVISSLLSHFILDEKLSLFGWISCIQCLLGSSILALNGPEEQSVTTIKEFRDLFVTPWFLTYGGGVIAISVFLAVWVAPRYGRKSMLPYIGICSLIGGLSVSCTQGLGACILTSIRGDNQFKDWFTYFLLAFVAITLLTEIYYLNVALALFNTAIVTPTYYVTFTFCTLVTSIILYKGLKASGTQIVTVVLAFLVICTGIFILQMSKVDPRRLSQVDDHTALLLEAARSEVDPLAVRRASLRRSTTLRSRRSQRSNLPSQISSGAASNEIGGSVPRVYLPGHITGDDDLEDFDIDFDDLASTQEIVQRTEVPGLDSLRGTFGAIGTIIRAKRRARALSAASHARTELTDNTVGRSSNARSEDAVRSRARSGSVMSGHFRPSWLPHGAWHTPRGSRFQAMEIPDDAPPVPPLPDLEKGEVEMRENGNVIRRSRSNVGSFVEFPSVWFRSRTPSPAVQRTSTTVQLDLLKEKPSKQSLASQRQLSAVGIEKSPSENLGPYGASVSSSKDGEDGEDSDDEGSFKSLNEKDVTEY